MGASYGSSLYGDGPYGGITRPPWWTHRLAYALGIDPAAGPLIQVRTYDHETGAWVVDPQLTNALIGYQVTYGRKTATGRVEALSANLTLATSRVPTTPEVAARLQVAIAPAAADALHLSPTDAVRFTGEVSDPTVDHAANRTGLVCIGRMARGFRRPVDGTTWPVEVDGARITRILAATGLDAGYVDPGDTTLAAPTSSDVAGKLVDQVVASSLGQLVEQPSGRLDWHGAEHRRGARIHTTFPASSVFKQITWSQRLDSLVNEVDVKTAAGTVVTVTDNESAADTRYGPWPAAVDTILTSTQDAYELGVDIVGRRAIPSWQLPDLTVDLIRTIDQAQLDDVLTLRHGSLLGLTDLPTGCPLPDEVYVEGWTETATPRAWRIQIAVSDPLISGTALRWTDVPASTTYQWQDLDPDLTWLDLARITDPTDTL